MLYFIGFLLYIIVIFIVAYIFFYVKRKREFKIRKNIYLTAPTLKQRIIWSATIIQFLAIFLVLLIGGTLLVITIQKEFIIPNDTLLYVITNDMYVFSIAWLFISIPLSGLILMIFHHEDYDYVAEYKGQPSGRIEENFTPLMVMLLIIFILAFPFCILGAGSYLYFTDSYIGSDELWGLSEKRYLYGDIVEVNVYYKKINKDYDFYYEVYLSENLSEDIFMERFNNIKRADEILQAKEVRINRETISKEDFSKMRTLFNQDFTELIEEIFYIENNYNSDFSKS